MSQVTDSLVNIALFNTMLGLINYSENDKEQALLESIEGKLNDILQQLNDIRHNQPTS